VPAAALERAGLARGDRVLASAAADDGSWLLGTRDALVVVQPADTLSIPWEQVESADWDKDGERLRVVQVADFGAVQPVHTFTVPQPGSLLAMVRERVTASVLLQRRVLLGGGKGVLVVARRSPRGRREVTWALEFDAGVNPADPAVRQAADAALRSVQDELGPGGPQI
jgi:hypothetical protein